MNSIGILKFAIAAVMQRVSQAAAVFGVLLFSSSINAESDQWYVGASVGGSTVDPDVVETGFKNVENKDTGFKLFVGKEISDQLATELIAADLGESELSTGDKVGYQLYGAAIKLTLPSSDAPVSVFGKGGLVVADINSEAPLEDDSRFSSFGGVGGEIKAGSSISLRGEYEFFNVDNQLLSIGVVKKFGGSSDDVIGIKRSPPITQDSRLVPKPVGTEKPPVPTLSRAERTIDKTVEVTNSAQRPVAVKHIPVDKKSTKRNRLSDSDSDGVLDTVDVCTETPSGVSVSKIGCATFFGIIRGVTFEPSSYYLTAQAKLTLDRVAGDLKQYQSKQFVIVGHTDNHESKSAKKLSLKRSLTVARHLVSKGVDKHRLKFAGAGANKPIESNTSKTGRTKNRRVEIFNAGF